MKNLSFALFSSCLFLTLSMSACTHSGTDVSPDVKSESAVEAAPPAAKLVVADPAQKPECKSETFCTREYLPTTCKFKGKDFASANPCEARKLARAFACESGANYNEKEVVCKSNRALKQ